MHKAIISFEKNRSTIKDILMFQRRSPENYPHNTGFSWSRRSCQSAWNYQRACVRNKKETGQRIGMFQASFLPVPVLRTPQGAVRYRSMELPAIQ